MNRLVIFGTGDIAELAHYYFENDSTSDVVAFVVDDAFKKEDEFQGKPVTVFSEIRRNFPNSGFDVFVALSYSKMNAVAHGVIDDKRLLQTFAEIDAQHFCLAFGVHLQR